MAEKKKELKGIPIGEFQMMEIRPNGSKRVYTNNTLPSKTDQQWKEDCDVNTIIAKFRKTGHVSHVAKGTGRYADVSAIPDLLDAMEQVHAAKHAFQMQPAKVRNYFSNSPNNMLEFLKDPNNKEKAIELGLIDKPEVIVAPPPEKTPAPTPTANAE